jgi:hypothetical protein
VIIFEIPVKRVTPAMNGGVTRLLQCSNCLTYAQYHTSTLVRFEEDDL